MLNVTDNKMDVFEGVMKEKQMQRKRLAIEATEQDKEMIQSLRQNIIDKKAVLGNLVTMDNPIYDNIVKDVDNILFNTDKYYALFNTCVDNTVITPRSIKDIEDVSRTISMLIYKYKSGIGNIDAQIAKCKKTESK